MPVVVFLHEPLVGIDVELAVRRQWIAAAAHVEWLFRLGLIARIRARRVLVPDVAPNGFSVGGSDRNHDVAMHVVPLIGDQWNLIELDNLVGACRHAIPHHDVSHLNWMLMGSEGVIGPGDRWRTRASFVCLFDIHAMPFMGFEQDVTVVRTAFRLESERDSDATDTRDDERGAPLPR